MLIFVVSNVCCKFTYTSLRLGVFTARLASVLENYFIFRLSVNEHGEKVGFILNWHMCLANICSSMPMASGKYVLCTSHNWLI